VQILRQRRGTTTNTTTTTLSAIHVATYKVNPLLSMNKKTPLAISRNDKNKQLTIIKATQPGINRNRSTFSTIKSSQTLTNFKTNRVPQLGYFCKLLSIF
jgi:hypothetical protein